MYNNQKIESNKEIDNPYKIEDTKLLLHHLNQLSERPAQFACNNLYDKRRLQQQQLQQKNYKKYPKSQNVVTDFTKNAFRIG